MVAETLTAGIAGGWPQDDRLREQSPNLFWSADRAWCVASEIDFDSTLVAGTSQLIEAVLRSPALDSWPIRPDDWLTCDADLLNPVSGSD